MVHYLKSSTGDEGHFYININVYPQGGYVYIDNISSGRCLDVRGAYTTVGSKTIIYAKNSSFKANQVWKIKPLSDGSVYLQSVLHPDRYLYINPTTLNAEISTNATPWYFNYIPYYEYYSIYSKSTTNNNILRLGVKDNATAANSEVVVSTTSSLTSQKWNLLRINNYVPVSGVIISSPTTESSFTKTLKNEDYENQTFTFSANIYPSTATNRAITWFSSNSEIATIDEESGEAKLKSLGVVEFFAKANDGTVVDRCRVNVISNFSYIKNYDSNRYFDIANGGTADGTKLLHWSYHGASNQIMKIVERSTNTFSIHPLPSMNAKAITVTDQGVTLQPYDENNSNQKFEIALPSNSFYKCRIILKGTTRCLTEDDTANKRIISTATATSASGLLAQEWTFESYESKAMSTVNFAAFSLFPDESYQYLVYNKIISQLPSFALDGNNYKEGACWKSQDFGTNNGAYISKNDLLYLMPYSDIVYIDSHATVDGIHLNDGTGETQYIVFSDIFTKYKNSERTITDSIFNKKTKWIIISACTQLDLTGHGDGGSNVDSAKGWAKAMLGDGQRLHGILGYYFEGPDDDDTNEIMDEFFALQSNDTSIPLIDAWALANAGFSTTLPWAALYHKENKNDRLVHMEQTTETGSPYEIQKLYLDNLDIISVDVSTSLSKEPLSVTKNNSEGISQVYSQCKTTPMSIYLSDDKTISLISNVNRVVYNNSNYSITSGVEIKTSKEKAAFEVQSFLSESGVIVGDNYTIECVPIVSETIDLHSEASSPIETTVVGYNFVFSQKDNEYYVNENSNYHNRVSVIWTSEGVSSFVSYNTPGNDSEVVTQ